jgi:3-methyladenine DNA glycosylase/8-oxoguanine DNA glycosylase
MVMIAGDFNQDEKIRTMLHQTLGVGRKTVDHFCLRLVMLLAILFSHA